MGKMKLRKKDLKQGTPDWVIAKKVGTPIHRMDCQGGDDCPLNDPSHRPLVRCLEMNPSWLGECFYGISNEYANIIQGGHRRMPVELHIRAALRSKKKRTKADEKRNRDKEWDLSGSD